MGRRMLGVAALAAAGALLGFPGSLSAGPSTAAARARPAILVSARVATSDPSTTIAPLGTSVPVPQATLPLRTSGSNAHVSPVFPILSGVGFALALLMVAARMFVTRRGGPDRRPYPVEPEGDDPAAAPDQSPASRSS